MSIFLIGAPKTGKTTFRNSWLAFNPNYLAIQSDDISSSIDVDNSISKEFAIASSKLPILIENSFIIDYYLKTQDIISDRNIFDYLSFLAEKKHTLSFFTFYNIENLSHITDKQKFDIISQNNLYLDFFNKAEYKFLDIKYFEETQNFLF